MEENANIQQPTSNKSSSQDLSRPSRFENFKNETSYTSNFSTSFTRFRKKDIKGFSLINEMTRIIEVGDSPGYDVRRCHKSLKKMIDEKDVTLEEIKSAVWDCGNDKAPEPDGFTFGFIKQYWVLLNNDIMEFVTRFLEMKKMPIGSNSSIITLIPK
nr:RNA-directed DNA polymerase, eukaryota, reverse transcriptase zinc-binding domain protein [Tanacetum cinerariifolium]